MKIGIIGGGKIAERHIHAYKHFQDIELYISDIDGNIAQNLCNKLNVNFSISPEAILGDATIDIVDVCTPTAHHKEIILEAIKKRKHVFCEKPLCQNLKEALEIRKAAELVLKDISPISDVRASAEYRKEMSILLTVDSMVKSLNRLGIEVEGWEL